MINTAEELIKRLQNEYKPDELLMYTIYSSGDIDSEDSKKFGTTPEEEWYDVIEQFNGTIDYCQEILNDSLGDLVTDLRIK